VLMTGYSRQPSDSSTPRSNPTYTDYGYHLLNILPFCDSKVELRYRQLRYRQMSTPQLN
jgi:hypothetical protein